VPVQEHRALATRRDVRSAGAPAAGFLRHYRQGRCIYDEGDEAHFFYEVRSGVVRMSSVLQDGRRLVDSFHTEGQLFGLEPARSHTLCAETLSDCNIVSYRWNGVEAKMSTDTMTSNWLFSYAMQTVTTARNHAILLGRKTATERVAAFLMEWVGRSPDPTVIVLAMSRQDIADYLGLTVETISRTFSKLERESLIQMTTSRLIEVRNRSALRRLSA
jgi:CRP/FNR family nitrogen fixation transcriptional regulator